MLTTDDHRRDSAGLQYVYPVISRRAGGVSIGINLNPNNACNWACVYCQVDNLTRGGPPPIDLERLASELMSFLDETALESFMQRQVPESARKLMDIAFSGNGEPTSASEFSEAVARVGMVLAAKGLAGKLPVRLISNGSLMHRPAVQAGLKTLAELSGEVWFKIDRATPDEIEQINGVPGDVDRIARNLAICAAHAPTWVQTCWFALDGIVPSLASQQAYCDLLKPLAGQLAGVHLYGLARPSMQAAAPRLRALTAKQLQVFADRVQKETGIRVLVSP